MTRFGRTVRTRATTAAAGKPDISRLVGPIDTTKLRWDNAGIDPNINHLNAARKNLPDDPAFRALKERMDPRKHNGGVFTGLNGVVVKSHGGTDDLGFATAIDVAVEMVRNGLVEKIAEDVGHVNALLAAPVAAPTENAVAG